jgi:DNA repair exonuclease SbcCD nuclease subunit
MPFSALVIGDQHFQMSNLSEVHIFVKRLLELVALQKPSIIICLGDLLHTHERLHTIALNTALDFIDELRKISPTYVIVGNHDLVNNQQFLSTNHWLNPMKEWENTFIVDTPLIQTIDDITILLTPYVYPGRFIESLDTLKEDFKNVDIIFAHQEFAGCKMGAIVSIDGDRWPVDYPHIISGHIHSKQRPQPNVYYPGSSMQHAFGESEKNIIAYVTSPKFIPLQKDSENPFEFSAFTSHDTYSLQEIDLHLPRKKIVYMNVDDINQYKLPDTEDKIKLTVSGSYEEFKALKKTTKYKDMTDKGLKIVFKPKKIEVENKDNTQSTDFNDILLSIVNNEKNPYLIQAYEKVLNNKDVNENEIMFI